MQDAKRVLIWPYKLQTNTLIPQSEQFVPTKLFIPFSWPPAQLPVEPVTCLWAPEWFPTDSWINNSHNGVIKECISTDFPSYLLFFIAFFRSTPFPRGLKNAILTIVAETVISPSSC